MPHHLVYLSHATQPLTDADLSALLDQSRRNNASLDLTGVLAYGNNQFLQVLEGDEQTVRTLYELIRQDPRHRNVATFADKHIPERAFPEWGMAFRPLAPEQFQQLLGYLSPTELGFEQQELSAVDGQLLQTLRGFVLG